MQCNIGYRTNSIENRNLYSRRLELALEGHYFFDLVRTGRLAATLTNWASTQALLPIPQRERDSNPKLTQNPGY
jgi:hypothetical protein